MANDDTPAGFLSRWSRRKVEVREGRPLEEPKHVPAVSIGVAPAAKSVAPSMQAPRTDGVPMSGDVATQQPQEAVVSKPMPSLADTQQLTPDSDFTGFMARGVSPDVKNAAMKKLFADPHFNVMDGLDIYIDDYSLPDPLPMAMLRQMASAKTLGLFDDEPENTEVSQVVAQYSPSENNSNIEPTTHDHADLRLQPDPTLRPEGAEPKPV
jgi:hypothetical protein